MLPKLFPTLLKPPFPLKLISQFSNIRIQVSSSPAAFPASTILAHLLIPEAPLTWDNSRPWLWQPLLHRGQGQLNLKRKR